MVSGSKPGIQLRLVSVQPACNEFHRGAGTRRSCSDDEPAFEKRHLAGGRIRNCCTHSSLAALSWDTSRKAIVAAPDGNFASGTTGRAAADAWGVASERCVVGGHEEHAHRVRRSLIS